MVKKEVQEAHETAEESVNLEEQKPAASEDEVLEKELEQQDERLPFPNARVVAIMKSELDKGKLVRARVKKEMNEWLGELCKRVTRDMNKSPYSVIEAGDLHRAIKKYEQLEEVAKQKERLVVAMQRIIQDCQMLISEIERSFDVK